MFNNQPLVRDLSGLEVEYPIIQIYCRDGGRKEASLSFGLWRKGDKDKPTAASGSMDVAFDSQPAILVKLHIRDWDGKSRTPSGKPIYASFVITDAEGRVYPATAHRLAPDFNFHPQIYRADGETVSLRAGDVRRRLDTQPEYRSGTASRSPPQTRAACRRKRLSSNAGSTPPFPAGTPAITTSTRPAAPTTKRPPRASQPEDMMRHILGEDLNVGCVLSWGPCWYFQKQYFEGKVSALSTPTNLMRYDVEVSGFPSSHCGHLCLLRLKEDDYPGTTRIEEWPSWDLPVLKWGKEQGGIVGYSHSGWGLKSRRRRCPPTTCRPSTASAPTNTSSTSFTTSAISFPRSTRRRCGS